MTVNELRDALKRDPFRPIVMHLADGREIPVHRREFVMPSPSGRTAIVYQPDDSFNVIDLQLVTALEFEADGHGAGA